MEITEGELKDNLICKNNGDMYLDGKLIRFEGTQKISPLQNLFQPIHLIHLRVVPMDIILL